MGLYKRCQHTGRARDRCEHGWWASFHHHGVLHRESLAKWANEEIRTKQHAQEVYERYRQAVRQGRAKQSPDTVTFNQLADWYVERYVLARALRTRSSIKYRLKPLREFFGSIALRDIRIADLDHFVADLRNPRRVRSHENYVLAVASINRHIALLRHMLNWAVAREYMDGTPFKRGSEPLIRLFREDNKRRRRISEEEEERLLANAPPPLRSRIITALDTGMRRGEMLALRFGDIDWDAQTITLRGETTKSGRTRKVPIATMRLKAVLEWSRIDDAGEQKHDDALVFSNTVGKHIRDFQTSWEKTILRAHGVKIERRKGRNRALTPECHRRLREINLRWHDLRHEYASRLVERGVPLSQVRDLLGHASIVTTERYDNHVFSALQVAAGRLETGKTFTSSSQVPTGRPRKQLSGSDNPQGEKDLADVDDDSPDGDLAKSHHIGSFEKSITAFLCGHHTANTSVSREGSQGINP